MPEGPEIKLAADRIATAIAGRTVHEIRFAFERLRPREAELRGRRVRAVEARGKALIVRFSGGLNLYSHNQLYGRWYVTAAGKIPRTGRQMRVEIHTAESSAYLYSASEIEVLRDPELKQHPYLRRLGLDVLDRAVTPAHLRERLADRRFAGRTLGGLLLDQGFLGGVGNYLRSEILFVAGIDPSRRPVDLETDGRASFSRAALSVSRRAYRTRGITNDPDIVKRMRSAKRSRDEYRHFVFDREGESCHRCGTAIEKSVVAGRRLYSCPACQR